MRDDSENEIRTISVTSEEFEEIQLILQVLKQEKEGRVPYFDKPSKVYDKFFDSLLDVHSLPEDVSRHYVPTGEAGARCDRDNIRSYFDKAMRVIGKEIS